MLWSQSFKMAKGVHEVCTSVLFYAGKLHTKKTPYVQFSPHIMKNNATLILCRTICRSESYSAWCQLPRRTSEDACLPSLTTRRIFGAKPFTTERYKPLGVIVPRVRKRSFELRLKSDYNAGVFWSPPPVLRNV